MNRFRTMLLMTAASAAALAVVAAASVGAPPERRSSVAAGPVLPAFADTITPFVPCNGISPNPPPDAQNKAGGPWASRIRTAVSDDGLTFVRAPFLQLDQADVPCAVVNPDGTVRVYFITWCPQVQNRIAVAVSRDLKEWTFTAIRIQGTGRGWGPPCDPTVIRLPDGRYRLYFTSGHPPGPGNICSWSAISDDGVDFALEGRAFRSAEAPVLDPSVLKCGETWVLFAGGLPSRPGLNRNHHAVSVDGLTFTALPHFASGRNIMANGLAVPGGYRYFSFSQDQPGRSVIHSLFSTDGISWRPEPGARIAADDETEQGGEKDPSVVLLPDGRYLMFTVTEIPSAGRGRR